MAITGDQERLIAAEPGQGYAMSGKIMLSAIVILFAVVVFMVGLHLYARWYLVRLRRRQLERRRQRRGARAHVVLYASSAAVDRGLELAVLNSLPIFLHSPEAEQPSPECAVCLSEFEEKEIVRLLPKCSHSFHIECIDMWFRSHSTCPLCRSPVEKVAGRAEPAVEPLEPVRELNNLNSPEPGPSSAAGSCDACQHEGGGTTSLGARKGADLVGVRIEVPPRRPESVFELTQSSPSSRLTYFKRILSMGRRSPAAAAASSSGGGGPTTPRGAGTSGGAGEMDLESGIGESNREHGGVATPR